MAFRFDLLKLLLLTSILEIVNGGSSSCQHFGVERGDKLYNFSLTSPNSLSPHGALSEDGFYKVEVNDTLLWFQICDGMIFNHDPPRCFDCQECGGQLHCGTTCSALFAHYVGGYQVCKTIGRASSTEISLIDEKNPDTGIIVKMSHNDGQVNCSLSVSVFCDYNELREPKSFEKLGTCDYATTLRHPSGCAKIISTHAGGLGWFGTLLIIILCLFGLYLLTGIVYRFFFLKVRGIQVIPNLGFWMTLPHRTKSFLQYTFARNRRPSGGHRSSYSPVNF
ncbi:hypothetical protein Scep_005756 [Stephania cephalantha]|uniref:Autophagy-related protein 27 n=1 Tax=Stephania cephalantha TaxID=152367 RepID=A0AAP0KWL8_9MAGN